jgi:hypothetical protein
MDPRGGLDTGEEKSLLPLPGFETRPSRPTCAYLCSVTLQSTSGPYISSDRRLSAKLVPTFADRGCHMVSAANPPRHNFDFLDRSRYYFFQVAPQLYIYVYTSGKSLSALL